MRSPPSLCADLSARSVGLRLYLRNERQLSATPNMARARACTLTSTREPRPEIFLKAPRAFAWDRDSLSASGWIHKFTAPEPELALILGSHGKILGFTLANDVSAWDIERENALYLPQSKVFTACCALGPVIVTRGRAKRSVHSGHDLRDHARRHARRLKARPRRRDCIGNSKR